MTFRVSTLAAPARESLGKDCMVTITHLPANIVLMLTAEEARALAMEILRKTPALTVVRKDA